MADERELTQEVEEEAAAEAAAIEGEEPVQTEDTSTSAGADITDGSYLQAKEQLDAIVAEVRRKDVSLEKSLDLLEEGVRLANRCTELIDQAAWEEMAPDGDDGSDAAAGAEDSAETSSDDDSAKASENSDPEIPETANPETPETPESSDETNEPTDTDTIA